MIISHNNPKLKPLNQDDFKMKIVEDLGRVFPTIESKQETRMAIAECNNCHTKFKVSTNNIKRAQSRFCGKCRNSHIYDGVSKEEAYQTWEDMKARCYNKNNPSYKWYGGEGVTICEEWINSPRVFIEWCKENGYKRGLEIDKDIICDKLNINPKIYSPKTCCFVSRTTNVRTTRRIISTNTSGFRGVSFRNDTKKWSSYIHIKNKRNSIGSFNTAIEAAKARDEYIIKNNLEHTRNFT